MALPQRSPSPQQARFNFSKNHLRSSFGENNVRTGSSASPLPPSNASYERSNEKFPVSVPSIFPERHSSAFSSFTTSFHDTISRGPDASASSLSASHKVHSVADAAFESASKPDAPLLYSISYGRLNIGNGPLYPSSPAPLEVEQQHSQYSITTPATATERSTRSRATILPTETPAAASDNVSFSDTTNQRTMRNSGTNPSSFSPYRNATEELASMPHGDGFSSFQKSEITREAPTGRAPTSQSDTFNPENVAYCFLEEYYSRFNTGPTALVELYHDSASLLWVLPFPFPNNSTVDPIVGREEFSGVPTVKMAEGKETIMSLLSTLFIGGSKTEVQWVHVLRSYSNSLLVSVKGRMWIRGEMARDFVQSFVLAALSPMWYFVHSDILRFLDLNVFLPSALGAPVPISDTALPMLPQPLSVAHPSVGTMEDKGVVAIPYAAVPMAASPGVSVSVLPTHDHPFHSFAVPSRDDLGVTPPISHGFSKDFSPPAVVLPSAVPYSEEARADGARILQLLQNYRPPPTVVGDVENKAVGASSTAPPHSSSLETPYVGRGPSTTILPFHTPVKSPNTLSLKQEIHSVPVSSDSSALAGVRRVEYNRREVKVSSNEPLIGIQPNIATEMILPEQAASAAEKSNDQRKAAYADIVMKDPKTVLQKGYKRFSIPQSTQSALLSDTVKYTKGSQSKTIFVVNLPSSLNETHIRECIKEQLITETEGHVVSIQHSKNQNKQFGFIEMDSEDSVEALLKKPLIIDGFRLLIERSTSKSRPFSKDGDTSQKYGGHTGSKTSAPAWKTTKQNTAMRDTTRHVVENHAISELIRTATETENQQNNTSSPTQKRSSILSPRRGTRFNSRENTSRGNRVRRNTEVKV
ncbi:hypothetical protein IE077_002841 [Cardiosporidium cionae]|uniref:RRM domain-containing protein n=1 Tax=Cardiosporidium cionae TaxID=476202 RepID=A0ABQ7JAR8_9APIC|nr:hypothetical protein IE077_002841 [Cardiosporidium cionae]|eukprot:KAF8820750.1 hypothetical protein IE077_002841 [Cardiosporidium cionae]